MLEEGVGIKKAVIVLEEITAFHVEAIFLFRYLHLAIYNPALVL